LQENDPAANKAPMVASKTRDRVFEVFSIVLIVYGPHRCEPDDKARE
jgi:hypothetical protein